MTFLAFCTPRAYKKALSKVPLIKEKLQASEIKIIPTADVYMNMLGGWSEAECDEVVYLVKETNNGNN